MVLQSLEFSAHVWTFAAAAATAASAAAVATAAHVEYHITGGLLSAKVARWSCCGIFSGHFWALCPPQFVVDKGHNI